MKIIKAILKIVGIFAAVIAVGIAALVAYASIDKTDTFYLKDAALANPNYLYELEDRLKKEEHYYRLLHDSPSVYIHRIKQGNGVILAYRWYSNGKLMTIDDEGFEKITIWLSNLDLKGNTALNLSDRSKVVAVYSKGGSAWPQNACSGYLASGDLVINNNSNGKYKVRLSGQLVPTGVRTLGNWCTARKIDKEFLAKQLQYKNITTWLGKAGQHPYDETYR